MRAMFIAVQDVAMDENKPATDKNIETTLKLMREMTKNAEHEMHAVVLFCKRARKRLRGHHRRRLELELRTAAPHGVHDLCDRK